MRRKLWETTRVEMAGDMTVCCGVHVWTSPENLKEVLNLEAQAAIAFVRSV